MKILFAKVPNNISKIYYDLENSYDLDESSEKYEFMFSDQDGSCYASPFSQYEMENNVCKFDIYKYFGMRVDFMQDVTIAFFVETEKGLLLDGWYGEAEIYSYVQSIDRGVNGYNFKSNVKSVVYLPVDIEIKCEVNFDDFIVPNKNIGKDIINFIESYTGEKQNLIIAEVLENTEIPRLSTLEEYFDAVDKLTVEDEICPKDLFKVIKICQKLLENGNISEKVYEILMWAFGLLRQPKQCLHYSKMLYELNRSNENKLAYAVSLYFSDDYISSIPLFQQLYNEQPNDLIRTYLGDLYHLIGHESKAFRMFDEITDREYLEGKMRMINEIAKVLPNSPGMRNFRVNKEIIAMPEDKCYLPIIEMDTPSEQIMNEKLYYLDPIRKKPILKTPEEEIRQKTIQYFITNLSVPKENILVEESLSHTDKSLKDRIDILIYSVENGVKRNLVIVECKEPNSVIIGEPIEQILRYNFYVDAKYLFITNGYENLIYYKKDSEEKFVCLSDLPVFGDLCNGYGIIVEPTERWERPTRSLIETQEYLDNGLFNFTVGEDSTKDNKVLSLNLHYCLVDPDEKIRTPLKGLLCNVVADHGLTYRKSGDPSGSKFDLNFRWLEVIDRNGETRNIYLAITGFAKSEKDPKYGTRKGTSNLYVCVEHKGKAVNMLCLCLDTHAKQNGSLFTLTHDGRRSRRTSQSTFEHIENYCPQLIVDRKVYLGKLDNSKNFSLTGETEQEFIVRLCDYTLLRYELWLQDRSK